MHIIPSGLSGNARWLENARATTGLVLERHTANICSLVCRHLDGGLKLLTLKFTIYIKIFPAENRFYQIFLLLII